MGSDPFMSSIMGSDPFINRVWGTKTEAPGESGNVLLPCRLGIALQRGGVQPHRLGHQFGEVADLGLLPAAVEHAGDVHPAAGVVADERPRSRPGGAMTFVLGGGAASGGEVYRVGPPPVAAPVRLFDRLSNARFA